MVQMGARQTKQKTKHPKRSSIGLSLWRGHESINTYLKLYLGLSTDVSWGVVAGAGVLVRATGAGV